MTDAIGGYFELELRKGEHYHKNALRLNTARNSFEYILRARKYTKVYIPYYTCDVMLEPLKKCNVDYVFYHINEQLEPVETYRLQPTEAFLYTNYYGLKQRCVERLAEQYDKQLIVDHAQAFFAEPLQGIDTFYSARKFFGATYWPNIKEWCDGNMIEYKLMTSLVPFPINKNLTCEILNK